MINDINKIFQIGFNKCGTNSIYNLFKFYSESDIPCIHWDNGNLALSMWEKFQSNQSLLEDYKYYIVLTDMEVYTYELDNHNYYFMFKYFDLLDKQYPNSKFILNTRCIYNWIISRLNHINYSFICNGQLKQIENGIPYYLSHMYMYKIHSISQLISIWEQEWQDHHNKVINYFKDRPDDLLVFDIEKDSLDKIKNFLPNIKFTVNTLPITNKTKVPS